MAIEGEKFGSVEIEVALDFERIEREKRSELPKRMQQVGRLSAEEIRKAEAEWDSRYAEKAGEQRAKNTAREIKKNSKTVGDAAEKAGKEAGDRMGDGMVGRLKEAMKAVAAIFVGSRVFRFLSGVVDEAKELQQSYLQLSASSKLFGVAQEDLNELARKGREEFRLVGSEANNLAVQTAKLAARSGDAAKAQQLMAAALDLGASQGFSATEVAVALEQALRGLDEGTDKLLQKNPMQIYEDYARGLGKSGAALSDVEQKQALVNAILDAGARVGGEYNRFLDSNLGKLQLWDRFILSAKQRIGDSLIPVLASWTEKQGILNQGVGIFVGLIQQLQVWGAQGAVVLQRLKVGFLNLLVTKGGLIGETADEMARKLEAARQELVFLQEAADQEVVNIFAPPSFSPSGTTTPLPTASASAAERAAEEAADRRLDGLKDDLQKRLADLTATAADDLLLAIEQMEADFYEAARKAGEAVAQGTIDGFQALRDEAVAIQGLEGFQEQFRGMLRLDDRGAQQQALSDLVTRLRQEATALKEGSRVRKEYLDLAEKVEEALKKNAEAIEKETKAEQKRTAADAQRQRQDELRDLRDRARLIEENARAALQLANAIGLVDDEAAKALENLAQLGAAIFRIAGGDLSAIPSAIGAIGSLVGSFLGGNKAEAAELQRQLAENARRIRENTQALNEFRERALSGISGSEREEIIRTGLRLGPAFLEGTPGETKTSLTNEELDKWSEMVGIDIPAWLQDLEDITGLEFFDPEKGLTDLQEFRRAWKDFLEKDLGAFDDSISGAIDAMLFKWSILGDAAGTAAEKVQEFIDTVASVEGGKAFADALAAALEEGGVDAANALIDEWARRFAAGDQSLFAEGGPFFGLDADEVRRLLEEGNGLLEDALAQGPGGTTRDAVQIRSITDVRASRMEGALYGIEALIAQGNEQRSQVLQALLGASSQRTSQAATAGFSVSPDRVASMPAGGGGVSVNVDVGGVHLAGGAGSGIIDEARIMAGVKQMVREEVLPEVKNMSRALAAERRAKLSAAGRQR